MFVFKCKSENEITIGTEVISLYGKRGFVTEISSTMRDSNGDETGGYVIEYVGSLTKSYIPKLDVVKYRTDTFGFEK